MPLFNADDGPALRPWLITHLEPICDAEPEVLSNYVLALLKHDAPESDLKETFRKQLYDFLDNETSGFVDELFAVIKSESYKASSKPPTAPRSAPVPSVPILAPAPTASSDAGIPIPIDALLGSKSDSRGTKRRLDSDGGPGDQQDRSPPKGPRLRDSRYDPYARHDNGGRTFRNDRDGSRNGARPPTGPAADRERTRNDERDTKRQPCRDYHGEHYSHMFRSRLMHRPERGFCARGSQCIFSHGEEAITPMGFPPTLGMMAPTFMMPWMLNQLGAGYDPNQALMDMSTPQPSNGNMDVIMVDTPSKHIGTSEAKVMTPSNDVPPTNGNNVARHQRGGHGAYGRNMRGRVTPAGSWHGETDGLDTQDPGSSSEPRRDRTLVVEKIPPERLSLEEINNWFKRFGTVTNVAIDVPSAKALVSFATHDEARDAWRSEDAVFGNRFVKLYWHRPMGNHGQAGAKLLAASAPIISNLSAPPKADPVPVKPTPPQPAAIDPSQQKFERLMAEQKVLMVKLTSANPDEKQSIKTRLRELITELQEVSAAMRNGSAAPSASSSSSKPEPQTNGTSKKREQLDNDLDMMSAEPQDTKETTSEGVNPELQAKLKKLREEAASLGLNTEAPQTHSAPPFRGYNPRGRGAWRGRGRGGPPRGSMKLDNRPRTLIVKGLPDTSEAKESARAWFTSFPECETVSLNETTGELQVKYKTRFAADQAMTSGATIPALGTLQFAWPSTPGSTTAPSATVPAKKSPVAEPVPLDTDIGMRADTAVDEDGWGASGGWDDDDEGGGRRDRM
ncbi:Zf-CCCH domain containing protein [Ceratobasidium theobromae]|uniref:Zf-CCCH domain containing protein n=1 Tax=Ceratobasidium theobromae TaxID=1582974 RepID=A0A5N5QRC5_9AGAM|nr:Zf-CCCH domain containing protein [Ceratobasidium theobromae]